MQFSNNAVKKSNAGKHRMLHIAIPTQLSTLKRQILILLKLLL